LLREGVERPNPHLRLIGECNIDASTWSEPVWLPVTLQCCIFDLAFGAERKRPPPQLSNPFFNRGLLEWLLARGEERKQVFSAAKNAQRPDERL